MAGPLETYLPHYDAATVQRVPVAASPDDAYAAIWRANLMRTPLARALTAVAMWPERIAAAVRREPPPPPSNRSATLRDMLTDASPWTLLADEPGRAVVLGLLWTPPAGGAKQPAEAFAGFDAPGFAKVGWSIAVEPSSDGSAVLTTETRTATTDASAARRFKLMWPLISPFAALLRMQVLRAVKDEAEGAAHEAPR